MDNSGKYQTLEPNNNLTKKKSAKQQQHENNFSFSV